MQKTKQTPRIVAGVYTHTHTRSFKRKDKYTIYNCKQRKRRKTIHI